MSSAIILNKAISFLLLQGVPAVLILYAFLTLM